MVVQGESSGNGEGVVDDFVVGIYLFYYVEYWDVVGKCCYYVGCCDVVYI